MASGRNWKENKYIPMVKVLCSGGKVVWANPSKPSTYRCTSCGLEGHERA